LREHLRAFQNGPFDAFHVQNDPLWNEDQVQHLLKRRAPTPADVKKERKKVYNRRQYDKSVKSLKEVKSQLGSQLSAKQITQDTYNAKLDEARRSVNIGAYKLYNKSRCLQDELSQAKVALSTAKDTGSHEDIVAAKERVKEVEQALLAEQQCSVYQMEERANLFRDLIDLYTTKEEPWARDSNGEIAKDSNGNNQLRYIRGTNGEKVCDDNGRPLIGIPDIIQPPNWSKPGRQDFLTLLALLLPPENWNEDPLDETNMRMVKQILHSDNRGRSKDKLGRHTTDIEKDEMLTTFNSSWELVQKWAQVADERDKQLFREEWEGEKLKAVDSLFPSHKQVPILCLHRVIREAIARVGEAVVEE
jgi:hypothetical protein